MFYDDIEVCKGESNSGDDSWARQRTRCMAPKDSVGSSRHQVIGGFLMQQVKIHSHLHCRMIRIKEAFWERVCSVCYECACACMWERVYSNYSSTLREGTVRSKPNSGFDFAIVSWSEVLLTTITTTESATLTEAAESSTY